jgi:hypothetical protein
MSTLRVLDKDGNWVDIPTIVGPVGPVGPTGATGPGVSSGGSTGQILRKKSGDDFDTEWITPTDMNLYYTKEEADDLINSKISTTFKYKGTKSSYAAIQAVTNPAVGDVWNDASTDHNYVWNGSSWDKLAGVVDMSNYYTMDEAEAKTNEAIQELGPGALMHYIGHYETEEDLPKSGGELIDTVVEVTETRYNVWTSTLGTGSGFSYAEFPTEKRNAFRGYLPELGSYYIGQTCKDAPAHHTIISSNYPETIVGIAAVTTNPTSASNPTKWVYHVKATPEKPVYVTSKSFRKGTGDVTTAEPTTVKYINVIYADGTHTFGKDFTITKEAWILNGQEAGYNAYLFGNVPQKITLERYPFDTLYYTYVLSNVGEERTYSSFYTIETFNCSYPGNNGGKINVGMPFIKFGSDDRAQLMDEAGIPLAPNDMVTVGAYREVYMYGESSEWEKWSNVPGFVSTEMQEADYENLENKNDSDLYILDRVAEVTETTNLLLNSITGDVDLVEANISEEEALEITNEIIGGVSDE